MKINKIEIYNKYSGRCAYCGCILDINNMQIDHIIPKREFYNLPFTGVNNKENLNPSCKECNHYKRGFSLKQYREWLLGGLHKRLSKLPKNTKSKNSIRRKNYLIVIADKYGISPDNPFNKIFYYEKINQPSQQDLWCNGSTTPASG